MRRRGLAERGAELGSAAMIALWPLRRIAIPPDAQALRPRPGTAAIGVEFHPAYHELDGLSQAPRRVRPVRGRTRAGRAREARRRSS